MTSEASWTHEDSGFFLEQCHQQGGAGEEVFLRGNKERFSRFQVDRA